MLRVIGSAIGPRGTASLVTPVLHPDNAATVVAANVRRLLNELPYAGPGSVGPQVQGSRVACGHANPRWEHVCMDEQVVAILRVADAAQAVAWYERLGFTQEWEHRIEPGCPAFVSVARGSARLFLSEHEGDARPDTLVQLYVGDITPVVAEFGRPAAEAPYGCEIELRDPDGNRLRISTAGGR